MSTAPAGQGVRDLTKGEPKRLIVSFALPVFLSQLFQQLYNTADTLIVGRFLGTEALAAVSSSGPLVFLMVSFFNGLAMGAGVVVSRYLGAHDHDRVDRAMHTTLAFGLTAGVLLTVVGVALTPTLLVWINTDPEVLPQAIEYFRYYFGGALSLVLYNVCCGTMNALGDSKSPLHYLIFSSITNVVLDLLFVGAFHWGVWSAAAATVIAQTASVILCLFKLTRSTQAFPLSLRRIRFHGDILREILKNGVPTGVQNSVIALANVTVQSQINSFGKLATAGYGSYNKIEGFAFLPITSFNSAITTFIGQNLGAKEYERAKRGARFGIVSAMVLAEVIGAVIYVFAPTLIGLFDDDPAVIAYGVQQARTIAFFYCLLAFSHAIASVCRGAGKAFVPMLVMLSVWCALRICYILLVMHFFGEIDYVYWAYPITWAISSAIYAVYYFKSDWVHGFER